MLLNEFRVDDKVFFFEFLNITEDAVLTRVIFSNLNLIHRLSRSWWPIILWYGNWDI